MGESIVKPATKNGAPIEFSYYIPFRFAIEKPKGLEINNRLKMVEENDVTSQLINNPFNYELYRKYVNKESEVNFDGSFYNEDEKYFKFLNEVRTANKYVKMYFNEFWQLCDANEASYYRITEWCGMKFPKNKFADFTIDGYLYSGQPHLKKQVSLL